MVQIWSMKRSSSSLGNSSEIGILWSAAICRLTERGLRKEESCTGDGFLMDAPFRMYGQQSMKKLTIWSLTEQRCDFMTQRLMRGAVFGSLRLKALSKL